ncbi:hydroxymethylbilane synthase [bacterium]|nr:hydroxymethylbilane synthase [bacterium]
MASKRYRLGTRNSALALAQARWVAAELGKRGIDCDLVEITSSGDQDRSRPLYEMEDLNPGLFCKRLQEALLRDEIDLAVHSLKDLPTLPPPGLKVFAVPERVSVRDCLLVHPGSYSPDLPLGLATGCTVGTSSLRREAQLLSLRPDVKVVSLRGNVPSRVAQVRDGKLGAAILAEAGLDRLGLALEGVRRAALREDDFIPAPAQGALGVEARESSEPALAAALHALNQPDLEKRTRIERRILRDLEGGCTLPLGVLCEPAAGGKYRVRAFLGAYQMSGEARRDWVSFRRFDISLEDEDALVAQVVAHFRGP